VQEKECIQFGKKNRDPLFDGGAFVKKDDVVVIVRQGIFRVKHYGIFSMVVINFFP
jgi:hypothetical protein